ncbi:hypothetical protein HYV79_04605 [Candidatus Woesearchaeota archaeon]|nr:hypothetical protein [Candidatus Woesearchaeota archaeon]
MEKFLTLVMKGCGHFGVVHDRYIQEKLCCTQCELFRKEHSQVAILKKKLVLKQNFPLKSFKETDQWIRKQLGVKRQSSSVRFLP